MLPVSTSNTIIGESLLHGESIASEFRAIFGGSVVSDIAVGRTIPQTLGGLRYISTLVMPIFAEAYFGSAMTAWLAAYDNQFRAMPAWLRSAINQAGSAPPDKPFLWEFERPEPDRIRFPKIEAAAKSLLNRRAMDREQFDELSSKAKAEAFTIAGDLGENTIAKVRDTLAKETLEGTSLDKFSKTIHNKIGKSAIGSGHLENVYRTNLQAAFRDGQASVMANPVVAAVFPYIEYIPVHDKRARHNHTLLGTLGLDGTGIYRRDDPFWEVFTPPWDYQCRCGTNNLTIEAAARKGVKEAIEWQRTGIAPETPEHRLEHIPFEHNEGWGQRHGKLVVV